MHPNFTLRPTRLTEMHAQFNQLPVSKEDRARIDRNKKRDKRQQCMESMAESDGSAKEVKMKKSFVTQQTQTTAQSTTQTHYETKEVQTSNMDHQDWKHEEISESFFYQLVAFIVEIAPDVIRRYFECFVLRGQSFEDYLSTINEKHTLFHIYQKMKCCGCVSFPEIANRSNLSKTQFSVLYKMDSTKHNPSHKKFQNGKTAQVCICSWSPRPNINTSVLDISLAHIVIKSCGKFELGADTWIETISDIRNEIFHKSDIKALSRNDFENSWEKLVGSVEGIAKLVSEEYSSEVQNRIDKIKDRVIISRVKLKLEHLCVDYWKQKSAELEINRNEEIEAFMMLLEGKSESGGQDMNLMKRKLKNVMTRIDNLHSEVDKVSVNVFGNYDVLNIMNETNVHQQYSVDEFIPVLMQLQVPNTWDSIKIEESIETIRTSMMSLSADIQITTCLDNSLTFLTTILQNLMTNKKIFKQEIHHILMQLLKMSEIDTNIPASVSLSLSAYMSSKRILETKFKLQLKRNFEEAGSHIADCLLMENGEVVFLVKTEHMGCKLYMRDEKLSEIQQKSISIDSQNIMIFGTDTVAILSKSCLTMINICTGLHTGEIPLPEDYTLAASNGSKEFIFYTNKSLSFIDCQGKTVRNINIAYEKCYLIHTTTKLVYLFSQNNQLSVCTKDGQEIQRHNLPEQVCSCTTAPDGGLIAVSNSSSVYHIDADGSIWSFIQSDFEPMIDIYIVGFCHRTQTLLFCHEFDCVSLYLYVNVE